MENLKVLSLSIPTLDSSECKALMGGDGYILGETIPEVVITPDQPERPDYDRDDDNQDFDLDDWDRNLGLDTDGKGINPPLTEEDLNAMLKRMDPLYAQKFMEAWKNGQVVKGDGFHNAKAPAYYDTRTGLIVINNLNIDQAGIMHEFTHFLQDQEKMLAHGYDTKGDANNEFQANWVQMVLDVADGAYGYRGWIDEKHNEDWLINHINYDEKTGQISIDQDIWDWLNDEGAMKDAMKEWLNYWNDIPNISPPYIQGNQDDWNYNWGAIFDQLGILHP